MSLKPSAKAFSAIIVVAILIVSGLLITSIEHQDLGSSGTLSSFTSVGQMRTYLSEHGMSNGEIGFINGGAIESTDASTGKSSYHSITNVQVSGVDEIDTVRTEGTYIFITSYDRVSIVKAWPADDMAYVSNITVEELLNNQSLSGYIEGMYLSDGLLIVIIDQNMKMDDSNGRFAFEMWTYHQGVMVVAVDITDPSSPVITERTAISGYSIGSRMIDGYLYVMTQQSVWSNNDLVIPKCGSGYDQEDIPITSICYDPNATLINTFTNILAIEIEGFKMNATSILTGYSSTIYVSGGSIYMTFVDWNHASISNDAAFTSSEDQNMPKTTIYRCEIDGLTVATVAKGTVLGFPQNQFSLDEYDGMLRIATCSGWTNRENMVFVLDMDLNIVGSLRGIAINESIMFTRFMGDTLYMITFLQVDPLFVIDLSEPTAPAILGELVIPGFSSYLHLIEGEMLIGIGNENGTLKISLYDISDPTNPVEIDSIVMTIWASSAAQYDHKAVMFDERYDMLAIPVYSYDPYNWYSHETVDVFSVGLSGLELRSELSNGENESSARCVVIDNNIFTITSSSVVSWDMDNLSQVDRLVYDDHVSMQRWYDLMVA